MKFRVKRGRDMPNTECQDHIYQVGHITFIVTPIYSPMQGENLLSILLKLMKADAEQD